jgi:hypothetical protein
VHRGQVRRELIGRLALRLGALGGGAALLGAVHVPRPATLCPLRAATGVPCPLCGTTTALVRLGRLDVAGALVANPVTTLALALLVLAPALYRRATPPVLLAAVAIAEAWQVARLTV